MCGQVNNGGGIDITPVETMMNHSTTVPPPPSPARVLQRPSRSPQ
jgi:hypothetical protein